MAKRLFDKQSIVAESLATLRRVNWLQGSPVDKNVIENEQFLEYINRDYNTNPAADKFFEKTIATAAYRKAKNSRFIPQKFREEFARRAVDEVRWVKLQANQNVISKSEYDLRSETNRCTGMLARFKVIKKFSLRKGEHLAVDAIISRIVETYPKAGIPLKILYWISRIVIMALPKDKKEEIKKKATEITNDAVEKVSSSLITLSNNGKKVASNVVDKMAEKMKAVEEKTVKITNGLENTVKKILVKAKEAADVTKSWIVNRFRTWTQTVKA